MISSLDTLKQLVKLFSQQHVDSCIMIVHRSIIDQAKLLERRIAFVLLSTLFK